MNYPFGTSRLDPIIRRYDKEILKVPFPVKYSHVLPDKKREAIQKLKDVYSVK